MRTTCAGLSLLVTVAIAACDGAMPSTTEPPVDAPDASWPPPQNRPYEVYLPPELPSSTPMPMLVALHGYGLDATWEAEYLHLRAIADAAGMLLVLPNGMPDATGKRFWNGTDCCIIDGEHVDDVGYLAAVIAQVQARYAIDDARVFMLGHSSGAFMAQRFACERGDLLAGIISLAGGQWLDPNDCPVGAPVSMLEIHGTADAIVWYGGGPTYPGAMETAQRWLLRNSCPNKLAVGGTIDLDALLLGKETTVATSAGCADATVVELWSLVGGSHIPTLVPETWIAALRDFLARA